MTPLVDIHTHTQRGGAIELLAVQTPDTPPTSLCALGVHPWRADVYSQDELQTIRTAQIAAVGEIGLDRACKADINRQRELFEAQISIAQERCLPIIIHSVRTIDETLGILTAHKVTNAVFHSFIGSSEQALKVVKAGYMLSVGERSLASSRTVAALHNVPLDAMFAETDVSELAINEIYNRLAAALGIDVDALRQAFYNNFTRIWKRG